MGAWAWGNDGTFGDTYNSGLLKEVYDTAMQKGFNLWDTAVAYGMGESEEILGTLAKDTKREDIIFSTKFTPQIEDGTQNAMQNMIDSSKSRLNTDFIDIYWIHNPMNVEKYTKMIIPLAKSGQIGQIGVSNHNLAQIKRVNEILGEENLKISAVQNHFSLLNRSSQDGGILDYCKENGITFYAYMVLEQGALTGVYNTSNPFPENSARGEVYNPNLHKIEILTNAMSEVGKAHNISTAQTAVAWAISKGTLPIVGVTKVKHVNDAYEAASVTLSADEMKYLESKADEIKLESIRFWEEKMA